MSVARHHADWLNLVPNSGPFVSLPVLMRTFPQGLEPRDPAQARLLREAYEEWQENPAAPGRQRAWVMYVLTAVLGYPQNQITEGQSLPPGLEADIPVQCETLRPDYALVGPAGADTAGRAQLLIVGYPAEQVLEKPVIGRHWKATPATRMMELLHGADVPLGLVTNGEQWMLVYAPRGETTGYASWFAALWMDEHITLRAFHSLLGVRRFFGVAADSTLPALLRESAQDQQEVTDQLGYQVREAVEVLVQSFDALDREGGGSLLEGVPETSLYNAALTIMMRLVFLFSAEERGLLHLGRPLYDDNYAVSTLQEQLQETADQHGEEVLERRFDAWARLLAAFRAVHGGIRHQDLLLPAYGGSLFDPDRYPFLEGRPADSMWRGTPAEPLAVNNRVVLHLLSALQRLQVRVPGGGPAESRRISFSALGVEQIGHVYEGLLDHTAVRATELVLGIQGTRKKEPEIPISTLESMLAQGPDKFLDWLKEETGRSAAALRKALDNDGLLDGHRLLIACGHDEALVARLRPFSGIIREDSFGRPLVILPGSVYVTAGSDRRSTGTHYTPPSLTEPIVQHTLEPLVYEGPAEGLPREKWVLKQPKEILGLKVCDMAMGSGAFLVQVCRFLAERLVEAWENVERGMGVGGEGLGAGDEEGGGGNQESNLAGRGLVRSSSQEAAGKSVTMGEGDYGRDALSGTRGVAGGHGPGGTVLSGHERLSEGGALWHDQPGPAGGSLHSGEHCRGARTGLDQGIPELSEHRQGLADGTGDPSDALLSRGTPDGAATEHPAGKDRQDQPDALRSAQGPAKTAIGGGRGAGDEGFGTGDKGRGTGDQAFGAGDEGRGTGNQGRGTGDQAFGAGDEGRGTGNQGRGTVIANSPTPNPQSPTPNPQPPIPNPQSPTPNPPITPYGLASIGDPRERLIPADPSERLAIARRYVADRCLYGVDINPMAVEMAKLSLWLITVDRDRPFTFLDHAFKCGDSLLGVSTVKQVENFSLRTGSHQMTLATANLFRYVDEAAAKRRALEEVPSNYPAQIEAKCKLYAEAEAATAKVKAIADVLMALELRGLSGKAYETARDTEAEAVQWRLKQDADTELRGERKAEGELALYARTQLGPRHPFHWAVEFPEIFSPAPRPQPPAPNPPPPTPSPQPQIPAPGFDAFVGNPPFVGGQRITGTMGTDYRDYLVAHLAGGLRGSADLCAYFFLRAGALLRYGGGMGLLATNTIAQGDTREVGLEQLVRQGFSIPRAVASRKWPGAANLEVAHVWMRKGPWKGGHVLEDKPAPGITPFLVIPGRVTGTPYRLAANANKSFQGSIVLGLGFVMAPEEARTLIGQNPKNKDVLYPYLNGEDLNSRWDQSPSRWVINFHDWPLDRSAPGSWDTADEKKRRKYLQEGRVPADYPDPVAADYPDCLKIVEQKVRPERMALPPKNSWNVSVAKYWWRFGAERVGLYATIAGMERVLVTAAVSPTTAFHFVGAGTVFAHKLIVFGLQNNCHFALLQSSIHREYAYHHSSTLGGVTLNYSPSDCFETFPFPDSCVLLEPLAESYYTYRVAVMRNRKEGLTVTYNRFHAYADRAEDISRLREQHAYMDNSVAVAYGWTDLDLGHDFHETKQGIRFTVSETARREILDRLLALNHQRYAEEVAQGLHDKGAKKAKGIKGAKKPAKTDQEELF